MKRILIPTLSLLLLAGCATQGTRMDSEKLDQLKPGISTIADAENLLGKPQSVARHPDGTTTLGYQFSSVQTDGKSMIPVVGYFVGNGTTSSVEYTGLNFDKTGHFLNSTSFQHN
jgi:outer membrane protein assembly factor BamE (lipoprotein component of BamABCDE complex)